MPRLAICSRDLHWHWINWTLLCDTMEVSMLRLAWLTTAQHVFQPVLTGRLELVLRKIDSRGPRTKAVGVSKFCEKLSPANWVQGVTAISRKILRSWSPKNGVQHATAIYPILWYTRPRYIRSTLYTINPLIRAASNPKTEIIVFSSCSCHFPIHWSEVSNQEWRCTWCSADRWCSN